MKSRTLDRLRNKTWGDNGFRLFDSKYKFCFVAQSDNMQGDRFFTVVLHVFYRGVAFWIWLHPRLPNIGKFDIRLPKRRNYETNSRP